MTALNAAADSVVTEADLDRSLDNLESYVVAQRYRGWDPYDALMSPLFRLPVLRSSRWIRVASERALKRLPFNIRPLLGIEKGATRFVLRDLPGGEEDDRTFCWAYYSGDDQRVLNASLKGARLCAQVWLVRGWGFYRGNFFHDGRVPKYYSNALLPVDATASAQSLVMLCPFGDVEAAARVGEWAVDNLQCEDGHFAYQRRRRRVVRIPYMRWCSAYMYLGLSRLAHALAGHQGSP